VELFAAEEGKSLSVFKTEMDRLLIGEGGGGQRSGECGGRVEKSSRPDGPKGLILLRYSRGRNRGGLRVEGMEGARGFEGQSGLVWSGSRRGEGEGGLNGSRQDRGSRALSPSPPPLSGTYFMAVLRNGRNWMLSVLLPEIILRKSDLGIDNRDNLL